MLAGQHCKCRQDILRHQTARRTESSRYATRRGQVGLLLLAAGNGGSARGKKKSRTGNWRLPAHLAEFRGGSPLADDSPRQANSNIIPQRHVRIRPSSPPRPSTSCPARHSSAPSLFQRLPGQAASAPETSRNASLRYGRPEPRSGRCGMTADSPTTPWEKPGC